MQKIVLPQQWTVRAISNSEEVPTSIQNREIPAEVPGCVHLDLLRQELIVDPYLGRNELEVQWIGRTDWQYRTTFTVSAEVLQEERVDLACDGLDTVATVKINGVEVGRSENMHVAQRFDVKAALIEGENTIEIVFASAALYARAMREQLGDLPTTYPDHEPYNFIRKNACNFGWDWGPTLITCGIWKEIRLEAWSVARIKSVRPLVKVANEDVAVVEILGEIEWVTPRPEIDHSTLKRDDPNFFPAFNIDAGLYFDRKKVANHGLFIHGGDRAFSFLLAVDKPNLWWPANHGIPALHSLTLVFMNYTAEASVAESEEDEAAGGKGMLDLFQTDIGLRTVELDTTPDEVGQAWTLKVNGKPIWCKGANWIPDDVFLPRANQTPRLRTRIQQALDANMNMLRIWGGGIYETEEFYSLCDEMGVLVWQDLLFACAAYAEEEPMRSLVEAEVRDNVTRLAKHPSLVLWNGCNENIWGWFDWGWQEKVGKRTWGAGYYFELFPEWIGELDPTRPYWPGSPFSGSLDIHPLADQFGNKHMWDTWNQVNHTNFRTYSPRFASEFGHQAPPTYATLARSIPEDQRDPFSPAMLHHQKANDGNDKLHARMLEHFEMPAQFDDWIYLTQLMQARAMQTAVEWFRTRSVCTGALYWQINDCWPVTSWAAIDGDGREKPLYWASQRFFAPRLLTIQPDGTGYAVWAHNDTDETWHGEVSLGLLNVSGASQREARYFLHAAPRQLVKLAHLDATWVPTDRTRHFLTASTPGAERAFWFFATDKEMHYPHPAGSTYDAELNDLGNGRYQLTVTAHTLLRDLCLFADRVSARSKGGFVTLLPGESFTFEIESEAPLQAAQLIAPPVLQDATRFGALGS